MAAASVAESAAVTEVFAILASAAVGLFVFYKLGTVESVIKTIASVVIFIGGLYAAGFVFPSIQETGWYQLIAWVVDNGPGLILEILPKGGTSS